MNPEFFKYTEIAPNPFLEGIVTHYRVKSIKLLSPLIFPNYSPIFQGLIFNFDELEDIIFKKKKDKNLKYKVYYVGQAVSPSYLFSSSQSLNLIAVNFTPTGLYQLTGIDLYHFTDKIVDAQIIFGDEIITLYEKLILSKNPIKAIGLIDYFLCRKAQNAKKQNKPCVLTSLSILSNKTEKLRITDLQKITNTSPKTLERAFKSEIGMTPKMFQRLLRFNQAKLYIQENRYTDWWEVVIRFGFYDHSHLISEFQTFSGFTPMQYMRMLSTPDTHTL